jgi:hypothetical protein
MVCKNCNRENKETSGFCVHCGAHLDEMTSKMTDRKAKYTGKAAKIGVFLVSVIPIFGLFVAFILALPKLKRQRIKLVALTIALIVINSFTTLFAYASVVLLMKNSLAQAVYLQSPGQQNPYVQVPSRGQSYTQEQPDSTSAIPGMGTFSFSGIAGINSIYMDSFNMEDIKGIITVPGEDKNTTDPSINKIPDDLPLPGDKKSTDSSEIDDDGSIYLDMDNDGKVEVKCDDEGNMFYDSDGDGVYETKYEQEYSEGAVTE